MDLKEYAVTRTAKPKPVANLPAWDISVKVCDSRTGQVVNDYTGANALSFPGMLMSLSTVEQDAAAKLIIDALLQRPAPPGGWTPAVVLLGEPIIVPFGDG